MRRLLFTLALFGMIAAACSISSVNDKPIFPQSYKSWKIISPYEAVWTGNPEANKNKIISGDTIYFNKPDKVSLSLRVDSSLKLNGELNPDKAHTGQFIVEVTDKAFSLATWRRDSAYTYHMAIDMVVPDFSQGLPSIYGSKGGWRSIHGYIKYNLHMTYIPHGNRNPDFFNAYFYIKDENKTFKPDTLPLYQSFQFNMDNTIHKRTYKSWDNTLPMYQIWQFKMPGSYEVLKFLVYGEKLPTH